MTDFILNLTCWALRVLLGAMVLALYIVAVFTPVAVLIIIYLGLTEVFAHV